MKLIGTVILTGAGLLVSLGILQAQEQAAPPDSIVQLTADSQGLPLVTTLRVSGTQIGLTDAQKEAVVREWGDTNCNTQISIAAESFGSEFKTNEAIQLLVRIKNLSTNEVYSIAVQGLITSTEDMSLVVISPSGKDISPHFQTGFRFSGGVVRVPPNRVDGFSFKLNDICEMNEVGTYKIVLKLSRFSKDRRQSSEIVSNPLHISITAR
jgi:hypothetical protein